MSELAAWLILLIPIASFVLIGLGRLVPALRRHQLWAGYLTILAIGASCALSVWALLSVLAHDGTAIGFAIHNWLNFGFFDQGTADRLTIPLGIHLDGLTAVMLV